VTDTPSSLPIFETGGVPFRCFIADGGARYVWRSIPNAESSVPDKGARALSVGRIGGKTWARSGGKLLGSDYKTIMDAMVAAVGRRETVKEAA